MIGKHVVVSTVHRGVFFGVLESRNDLELTLTDARMCVYWDKVTRGFVGLAAVGPTGGSRVSFACPRLTLTGITAIIECSDEATKKWLEGPWN